MVKILFFLGAAVRNACDARLGDTVGLSLLIAVVVVRLFFVYLIAI